MRNHKAIIFITFLILSTVPITLSESECSNDKESVDKKKALLLKIAAIVSILIGGFIGVCFPILGRWVEPLRPEKDVFFIIKAFAAGVILATGFIHILPDAFDDLTSPCLNENPWQQFPFAGFIAMMGAIMTLVIDSLATGYYNRVHYGKEEKDIEEDAHVEHVHVHTHSGHGHAHGSAAPPGPDQAIIRHRVVSQVLEMGIVVHSVIIGISLGASENPSTIKPLVAALTFHQFFEGTGLGGCIVQAQFEVKKMVTMILFFSLTTPVGIAIGIGISSKYNENSPSALITQGVLNSAAAGILIYMALVDLLAADFMNPRVQKKGILQAGVNVSLLVGAGLMSMLAKWA